MNIRLFLIHEQIVKGALDLDGFLNVMVLDLFIAGLEEKEQHR